MISPELKRLASLGFNVQVDAAMVEMLVRQGYHRTLGARPMRNTVERFLQDGAASSVLETAGDSERG
jgi:ATP-dependent Clp protease ATP-binding subunit ClpA